MSAEPVLEDLIQEVMAGAKYAVLDPELVRRVTAQEWAKYPQRKEAVKAARSKLHQIGAAYQEKPIPYARLEAELQGLPRNLQSPDVRAYCLKAMTYHASTQERLPILENFYREIFAGFGPVQSILDLACGLNPLALAWIPLAEICTYTACDIYCDQADYLNRFFNWSGISGQAFCCDLVQTVPQTPVQVAFLLKTIPCLEQMDKNIGPRLLEQIQAEHILVTFPVRSLGGHFKGMRQTYDAHFTELLAGKNWAVKRFDFDTELAYLVSK